MLRFGTVMLLRKEKTMKKTIAFLLLVSLLFCVENVTVANSSYPFEVTIAESFWDINTELAGDELLVTPYVKILVRNNQDYAANQIAVWVVFYNEAEKTVWSEEKIDLVANGNSPLRAGYSKATFVHSSVGYPKKTDVDSLPDISAEIYINNTLYGLIKIEKSYEVGAINTVLDPEKAKSYEGTGESQNDSFLAQPMKTAADFNPSEYTYEALEEILEKVTKELSSRSQNADAGQKTTAGKVNDENEGIIIICPNTIEKDGVTVEIKDLYIKCRNTESTQYDYDGNFLYATAEIIKVRKNESYFSIRFDMYDDNDRYLGDFGILYTDNLDTKSEGKLINGNSILSAIGVAKIVYKD